MNNVLQPSEGVIKYQLMHQQGLPDDMPDITELNAWRTILHKLGLIGQRPDKYDGLGYGNISSRLQPDSNRFIISATQTGHLPQLQKSQYVLIEQAIPENNSIQSCGAYPPSSEALTHATVYQLDHTAQAVIHVHSPQLWHKTELLRIPFTAADVAYGTPEMAFAVAALFQSGQLTHRPIFSMLGHEDGLVCFGKTVSAAALLIINELIKAIQFESGRQSD